MPKPLPNWQSDVGSIREFSRIRLIVLDLDGTLISSTISHITSRIQALRRKLSHYSRQVQLTVATGRTMAGVSPLLTSLQLPTGRPIILYNGSLIIKNKTLEVLDQRIISPKQLTDILRLVERYPVRVFAYAFLNTKEGEFTLRSDPEVVLGWTTISKVDQEFNRMPVCWQQDHVIEDFSASAVLIDTSIDPTIAIELEAELLNREGISITRSGSTYVEIRPQNSNKAVALQKVAAIMGLSQEEILTLGDNDNDAEMLAWAGIGVAIAQASLIAKASSDYICQYGVAEGAAEVLNLIIQAKRYFPSPKIF